MQPRRRKATIRLPGYDYGRDGLYFVTSCVQDRICHFGDVVKGEMILSEAGLIAHEQWYWLLQRYPYVASHAFIVMPNHIHAVLEINRGLIAEKNAAMEAEAPSRVRTGRDLSVHEMGLEIGNPNPEEDHNPDFLTFESINPPTNESQLFDQPIKIKPLDQLIGAYKMTSSKLIHGIGRDDFRWQRSYHDHIIRAEGAYHRIVAYINSNPVRWEEDKFYHD